MKKFKPLIDDPKRHRAMFRCRVCLSQNFISELAETKAEDFKVLIFKSMYPLAFILCSKCKDVTLMDLCQIKPATKEAEE